MEKPLYIAFLWHMHQPFYKDPLTGEITLPWVRLHAVKDYFNMVDLLKGFPAIRQTFNVVPSLLDQLEDYTRDSLPNEKFLNLSIKPSKGLTPEDKKFILLNFFMANWDNMIAPFKRFNDLLEKRGRFISPAYADRAADNFKAQDYLDLQVLFNLCWFDPVYRNTDSALKELAKKGSRFSEEDKAVLMQKQIELIKKIIPLYKQMQERSQIEIAVSPYYHPILPLLCDTDNAKVAMPGAPMPRKRFSQPQDAKQQIEDAVKRYEGLFGKKPKGMWSSEGSVAEGILPLLTDCGIKWIATDEGILLRSINRPRTAESLYRPYLLKRQKGSLNIIFRDHNLSDLVGFTYQNVPAARAVADFISHLHEIRRVLKSSEGNFLVSVILDGENAWEYYPNNGRDFLSLLYLRLSEESALLRTTTVSDFLDQNPPRQEITALYPGSWINSDFSTWIGCEEKNASWDYLSIARSDLEGFQKRHADAAASEKIEKAWRQIYIAEGSDWNWWYGPQNSSSCDEEFDRLYRKHLLNVYELMGQPAPDILKVPISTKTARPLRYGTGFIRPTIDGLESTYYEWLESACFDVAASGGTMHRTQSLMQSICCGFDQTHVYIKIVSNFPDAAFRSKADVKLVISKLPPKEIRIEIPLFANNENGLKAYVYARPDSGEWKLMKEAAEVAYKKVLELGLTFEDLRIHEGEEFRMAFFIEEKDITIERQPESGPIRLICPTSDYEAYNWTV
jgi:alpha-amylase/alpha-mannosidase (GH57 family)